MNPVETYLRELQSIHSSRVGVKETTYYPALKNLLDDIGKTLKPKVRCVVHPAGQGAGNPDGLMRVTRVATSRYPKRDFFRSPVQRGFPLRGGGGAGGERRPTQRPPRPREGLDSLPPRRVAESPLVSS